MKGDDDDGGGGRKNSRPGAQVFERAQGLNIAFGNPLTSTGVICPWRSSPASVFIRN